MKRLLASILILPMLVLPVQAETIKWVDFNVPYESMKYALDQDIATFEQEKHISWIDIWRWRPAAPGESALLLR